MEPHHVSLLVGRKSYNILTSLDDASLKDVYSILHDAVAETDAAMEQDERLFLAAMMLANELSMLGDTLGRMRSLLEPHVSFGAADRDGAAHAEAHEDADN